MFVNEDVVHATEQRIAAKGIELSSQLEVDLYEFAHTSGLERVWPEIETKAGTRRVRIPMPVGDRPPRRSDDR